MGQRRHTSRHTSPKDGDARHARKATALSSRRLPTFIQRLHVKLAWSFSQKRYFDCQKTKKERALGLPGKLPAPYNSRDFYWRFGSGSPLPRLMPDITAIYGRRLSWRESAAKNIDG